MKSFKKMVSEVAQPAKSKEEKAFKDMHSYETKSHPVAPDAVFTGDIGKPKASRKADQEGDINYDKQFKRESFDIAENVKASIAKSLSKSGESSKEGKKAVTLKKAPWEKNEATMTEQTCSCCDSNIDEDGKCACGSDCPECGGQHEVSEAGCGSSKKRNEEVEELDEIGNTPAGKKKLKNLIVNRTQKAVDAGASLERRPEKAAQYDKAQKRHMKTIGRAAERLAKEEVELDEISQAKKDDYIKKSSADRQGAWSKKNIADRLRDKKTSAAMKIKMAKRDKGMSRAMGEELSPAQKKIDHNKNGRIDGKDLAALRAKKKNESVELDESVKTGNMKLKDGKTINVSKQDAMLLNQMMKDLNPKNRKEMQKVMMTDKAGFDEIVGFAREAL